jgi:hypothetical protein
MEASQLWSTLGPGSPADELVEQSVHGGGSGRRLTWSVRAVGPTSGVQRLEIEVGRLVGY